MKEYIQELVNRLRQFSEKLDNTALFVDKPWILIDNEANYHKYIFKKDSQLIMSLNGKVQIGKWELLTTAKSILVDRIEDKILLNQYFLDSAIMVLKVDGINRDFFVLANENLIPDLNVKDYLQSLINTKLNIAKAMLTDGRTIEINVGKSERVSIGMEAYINNEFPDDGKYQSINTGKIYYLKAGKIDKVISPKEIKCKGGINVIIEQKHDYEISIGDKVFIDTISAPDGKYRFGIFNSIEVQNGEVATIQIL